MSPQTFAHSLQKPAERFSWDTFEYVSHLHGQSPDIAQGVNRKSRQKQGAGDQGMMFGYATSEKLEKMLASGKVFDFRPYGNTDQ